MDFELLISRLSRAIITDLQGKQRTTVLIFCRRDQPLPERLTEQLGPDFRIMYSGDAYRLAKADRFILPCLYIDQMVDLALGKGGSRLMYAVRQVLLAGRTVEVFSWEYRQYLESGPRPLLERYEKYRRQLESYGLIDWLPEKDRPLRLDRRVLTEADVRGAQDRGARQLDLPGHCRITPLAVETARDLGIILSTEKGGRT